MNSTEQAYKCQETSHPNITWYVFPSFQSMNFEPQEPVSPQWWRNCLSAKFHNSCGGSQNPAGRKSLWRKRLPSQFHHPHKATCFVWCVLTQEKRRCFKSSEAVSAGLEIRMNHSLLMNHLTVQGAFCLKHQLMTCLGNFPITYWFVDAA